MIFSSKKKKTLQVNATSLIVLDLEDEKIPPSDIIMYMVSTALDVHEKDEININIKISKETVDADKVASFYQFLQS